MTVRVRVIVLENDDEVGSHDIGYFEHQPYSVEIRTPDGLDAVVVNRQTIEPVKS